MTTNPIASSLSTALTLEAALETFLSALAGKNRSPSTIRAYGTDIAQFIDWLQTNNVVIESPDDVKRIDIHEYLSYLGQRELTGISRARKLAAIREYFRFLANNGYVDRSPTAGVETPKKEKNSRTYLLPDEYTRMLSLAGGNVRDYAILQTFLQTGVRVSELCSLMLDDLDLSAHQIKVRGKGMVTREIELEKKAIQAIGNWLAVRPDVAYPNLFLNVSGEPIGERGVRKLVVKYRNQAGITKNASCHSLRHTFATYKAERGISPFQLQQWLGHANLNTTQIYVHLGRQNARKLMEATSL